jgi:SET domain-containing protein 6
LHFCRQAVLEDKKLIEEDWEECILPLCEKNPHDFPAVHFTLEDYFLAKTLISSRAFEVDEYHGYGMVPLADLCVCYL